MLAILNLLSCPFSISFRWIGYEHDKYNGRQYILEEGDYSSPGEWQGSNDQLSSLKKLNPVSSLNSFKSFIIHSCNLTLCFEYPFPLLVNVFFAQR